VNVLSLFAGIGGLELGLERAGMTTVGQVELDPWCRWWAAEPDVARVVHGLSSRMDHLEGRRHALGNAVVVPVVAEHIGRLILASSTEQAAS